MNGVATEAATTVVIPVVLEGRFVRLEPLTAAHAPGLLAAASGSRDTYGLTLVPGTLAEAAAYIDGALGEQNARRFPARHTGRTGNQDFCHASASLTNAKSSAVNDRFDAMLTAAPPRRLPGLAAS